MNEYYVYKLTKGSTIVYFGNTEKDLDEVVKDHRGQGWDFDSSECIGTLPDKETAQDLCEVQLKDYESKNSQLPKYNIEQE